MGEPSAVFRSVNLDFNENCIGGEKQLRDLVVGSGKILEIKLIAAICVLLALGLAILKFKFVKDSDKHYLV
jgi:hypothetical protein